ncbi:MAG: hypothetical protein NTZ40_00230 [Cyanobacteria bacterium]|nr:hypothetical protein [Cyanobacteriota bacterium]
MIACQDCAPASLAWIGLREFVLGLFLSPALLLPLVGIAAVLLASSFNLSLPQRLVRMLLLPLVVSTI